MATLAEKKAVVESLIEKIKESDAIYVANYKGMSVAGISTFREKLREKDVKLTVYNNTLIKRALSEIGGYEEFSEHLVEQNAYMLVTGDTSSPAKVLKEHLKSNDKPTFKAAIIEGAVYGENQLDALAAMKSKEEVIGDIIGLLMSPANNIVSALQGQGSNLVGAIKEIAEKAEK